MNHYSLKDLSSQRIQLDGLSETAVQIERLLLVKSWQPVSPLCCTLMSI